MTNRLLLPISLAVVAPLVAAPAFAQAPPPPPPPAVEVAPQAAPPPPPPPVFSPRGLTIQLSSLRLLREKGVISQAEYESALHDITDSAGGRADDATTLVVSKFAATVYGFAEGDVILDSTQSLTDILGNTQIARPTTYAGGNNRLTFGIRNSRLGIRIKSPETSWFRASGVLESDFEGATLPIGVGQPYFGTEAAFFNNPTFRVRHAYVKFETPVVDILVGQTWHLFGWQGNYFPSTVQIQGIVAELFNRTAQVRLSHTFKSEVINVELAVAAMRSPQRDSGVPEGTAGLRLIFPTWTGMQTLNSTGSQIAPASIAVSGTVRQLLLPPLSTAATNNDTKYNKLFGSGIAADAFIPIIPATKTSKGNSLSLSGEVAYSRGAGDLYTGLTGGVSNPALPTPAPTAANPNPVAPTYVPDLDPGIAQYNYKTGLAEAVRWTTFNVGLQYYLPGLDGRLWVSLNVLRSGSSNTGDFLGIAPTATAAATKTAQGKVRDNELMEDVNIFGDPYPGVRFGLEYSHIADAYLDGATAVNHRVQFSGFYIF
jgi:hypothetical protein